LGFFSFASHFLFHLCVAASEDSDEDSSSDEEEEGVGLLGKRKKPADTAKATPAKKARNGDAATTPQQNGESEGKV
jgi:hypothetical protein